MVELMICPYGVAKHQLTEQISYKPHRHGTLRVQVTALREVVFSGKQKVTLHPNTSQTPALESAVSCLLEVPFPLHRSQAGPSQAPGAPKGAPALSDWHNLRGSLSTAFSQHLHCSSTTGPAPSRGAWSTPKPSAFASCISRPKGKVFSSSNSL